MMTFSMHARELGWNARNFVEKFCNEEREVTTVKIRGKLYESMRIEYILAALEGSQVFYLDLSNGSLPGSGATYLVQGLPNTNITHLNLFDSSIRVETLEDLATGLKDTKLRFLNVSYNNFGDEGMKHLTEGLKSSKVATLYIRKCGILFEGVRYLADALEHVSITTLHLDENELGDEGVTYLAERLKNSVIDLLNLNRVGMSNYGIRNLIGGLKSSSVTQLYIFDNGYDEYRFRGFVEHLRETQISELKSCVSCDNFTKTILARNSEAEKKLVTVFQKLVSKNKQTDDLEFMIPAEKQDLNIEEYVYLIRTVNSSPVINGKLLRYLLPCYNYSAPLLVEKIKVFWKTVSDKFNVFINNDIPHFIEICSCKDFVNLMKQFEDSDYGDIVQNLLLHRSLFYIDENKEVLHPFIYKLLEKYKLPLYNELLEPNKKEFLISYFAENKDIDGADEIINLLQSDSN